MLPFILAIFWAFVCPSHTNTNHNHNPNSGQVTTLDDGDTGGENGPIPTKPPKP